MAELREAAARQDIRLAGMQHEMQMERERMQHQLKLERLRLEVRTVGGGGGAAATPNPHVNSLEARVREIELRCASREAHLGNLLQNIQTKSLQEQEARRPVAVDMWW